MARVWDAVSGEEILVLAHGSWVNQASWNGEESLILTASSDGTARVWDAVRGEEILTLVHEGRVSQASWNGEENLILTASDDNMARVWDAVSGEELFRLSGDGSAVLDAVWNSDESQIMIATEGGHVFRYFTEMKDLFDLACNRIGRNMSLAEWQTYYRSEPYACVCPNQPAHPTVLAAVDEGRITLAKDAQCAAD
jgi:WD40 repeat protein